MSPRDLSSSTLVTVVAWVSIVLSGLMTLMTMLQNLTLLVLMHGPESERPAPDPAALDGEPRVVVWLFEHVELWFAFWLAVSLTALVASVGLLRRREWGRRLYLGVLGFGVAWIVIATMAYFLLDPMAPDLDRPELVTVRRMMTMAMTAMSVLLAGAFGWLGWRLTRPEVREEFGRG